MAQRGAYRAVFSALFDDPDYQWLPKDCRLLLLTLRQCKDAGPAAIFRYYSAQLSAQTGLTVKAISGAMATLRERGWIDYDEVVAWVRNGLRYDPHVTLADPKHRKGIEKHLESLPRSLIVLKFCDYYEIARPFEGPSEALARPFEAGKGSREPEREPRREPERSIGHVVLSDDQFLDSLKSSPAYHGIDIDRELARMDAWLLTPKARGRKKTRQFIVNWLNRIDRPMNGTASEATLFSPKTAGNAEALRRAGERIMRGEG